MNPLEGRLIVISRLIAKRDALFSARPHVPLVIEPDPARKLALAMSLADVCSCLADEDISRGHPIKLLVRIIFSAPVRRRHRAVGGPFYALRSSQPSADTPDGSPESREQRGIAMDLVCFLFSRSPCRRIACARRCCYIHLCSDAAASFTSGRISRTRRRSGAGSPASVS
jgi:hypothetical protein